MFLTMVHWFLVVVQQLLGSWDCCLGQLLKDSAGCLKIYIHMGYYQYFKYILRLTTHPWITNPSNCLGRKFPRDAAVLFPWPIFTCMSIERRGWCATETSPHSGQIPPPLTHTQPHLCKIHLELVLSRNSACSFILYTGIIPFLIKSSNWLAPSGALVFILVKVIKGPNMCYIFEMQGVQGYQI